MAGLFINFFDQFRKKSEQQLPHAATAEAEHIPAFFVQLAVYDSPYNPPRVLYITSDDFSELTHNIANEAFSFALSKGGQIPYVTIKEVVENLIHAQFKDVVITILADGNTIRIADRGPGIKDKEKVFLPGFSTATTDMKRFIKGVGSGLTVAREAIGYFKGSILIEDNLGIGTVITLMIPKQEPEILITNQLVHSQNQELPITNLTTSTDDPDINHRKLHELLSSRQKKILLLVAEINETGPSYIAKELSMSLSTAFRELVYLEDLQLITSLHSGKRKLTEKGLTYIGSIFE